MISICRQPRSQFSKRSSVHTTMMSPHLKATSKVSHIPSGSFDNAHQARSTVTDPADDSSGQEEEQPPHTAEIGTLKKLSVSGGTAWLGSSSGVYFVNTVRRAFSAAFAATSSDQDGEYVPASEDIITGEDAAGQSVNGSTAGSTLNSNTNPSSAHRLLGQNHYEPDFLRRIITSVGRPPADRKLAMDLVTTFFSQTHPLFPFLHGPTFLANMNEIYTAMAQSPTQPKSQSTSRPQTPRSTVTKQGSGSGSSRTPSKSQTGTRRSEPNTSSRRTTNIQSTNTAAMSDQTLGLGALSSVDPLKIITFQIIINIAALSHTPQPSTSAASTTTPTATKPKSITGCSSPLPVSSTIPSAHSLLTLILPLSTTPLLPTIQLLLAAELYLLSTISLRHSSTVAGLVLRLIYHVGLHRCPLRYASLTPADCEIRKRIFWSAYALDRHLSLALGDPNTFQDSDIDVCLSRSGEGELHRAVARELLGDRERGEEWRMHFPRDARGKVVLGDLDQKKHHQQQQDKQKETQQRTDKESAGVSSADPADDMTRNEGDNNAEGTDRITDMNTTTEAKTTAKISAMMQDDPRTRSGATISSAPTSTSIRTQQLREAALTAYVQYGKLTGRIIEIFHKSINFRFPKQDAIGYLTADIENWWNDLPSTLTGDYTPSSTVPNSSDSTDATNPKPHDASGQDQHIDPSLVQQHKLLTPFFTLLYHQLLLLLNRPRLSLDQSTAEFQQGLQVCIRASRSTLTVLRKHKENGQSMFLPGLLSAAWMSGLIIAFACQLGKYPKQRACGDIKSCLLLLESMNLKWYTVKNIHKVLSLLLANITSRKANSSGYLSASRNDSTSATRMTTSPTQMSSVEPTLRRRKRRLESTSMEDGTEAEPSCKRDSMASNSPISPDLRNSSHFNSPDVRPTAGITSHPPTHLHDDDSQDEVLTPNAVAEQPRTFSPSDFDLLGSDTALQGEFGLDVTNLGGVSVAAKDSSVRNQQRAGAALYADPQDMAFAQSNHSMGLPELSSSLDDQMFWSNMDSNLFDVFGAVSWESMTGPGGPMVTNPSSWDMSAFTDIGGGGNADSTDAFMDDNVL